MISNIILRSKNVWKVLHHTTKYYHMFPNARQMRQIDMRFQPDYTKDDLMFPYLTEKFNGGVQQLVDNVKNNPNLELRPYNIAYLLYHCGLNDIRDALVFEAIERSLPKYVGHFDTRWAFGGLYGMYRTNSGTIKGIEFFEKEFIRVLPNTPIRDIIELVEGMSFNIQVSDQHKINFINTHLRPAIIEKWGRLKHHIKSLLTLFNVIIVDLDYYDQELSDMILQAMREKKNLKQFDNVVHIAKSLIILQESGKFYRDLSEDISHWKGSLSRRDDITWRFNVDTMQFYTYEELKAKRDDFKYMNQNITYREKELTEEEKKALEAKKAAEEERAEREAREKSFNDIIRDRFLRVMRGDLTTGLEGIEDEEIESEVTAIAEQGEDQDVPEADENDAEVNIKITNKEKEVLKVDKVKMKKEGGKAVLKEIKEEDEL